jgi:hypothetical protein
MTLSLMFALNCIACGQQRGKPVIMGIKLSRQISGSNDASYMRELNKKLSNPAIKHDDAKILIDKLMIDINELKPNIVYHHLYDLLNMISLEKEVGQIISDSILKIFKEQVDISYKENVQVFDHAEYSFQESVEINGIMFDVYLMKEAKYVFRGVLNNPFEISISINGPFMGILDECNKVQSKCNPKWTTTNNSLINEIKIIYNKHCELELEKQIKGNKEEIKGSEKPKKSRFEKPNKRSIFSIIRSMFRCDLPI